MVKTIVSEKRYDIHRVSHSFIQCEQQVLVDDGEDMPAFGDIHF